MNPGDRSHEEVRRVAEALKRKIQESGLPYREVEERAGIGRDYLRQVLRGSVKLRLEHVFTILDALDVPPAAFFAELYGPVPTALPVRTRRLGPGVEEVVALLERSFADLLRTLSDLQLKDIDIEEKDDGTVELQVRTPRRPLR